MLKIIVSKEQQAYSTMLVLSIKFICNFISESKDFFPNEDEQVVGITNCVVSPKQEDNTTIFSSSRPTATKPEEDFDRPKLDVTTCKNEGMFSNIKSLHIFL